MSGAPAATVVYVEAEIEHQAWSMPDDFEWIDLQSNLLPSDENSSDVYAGLRALMENDATDEEVFELIEAPINANYANGARERVNGSLWKSIDAAELPELVRAAREDGDEPAPLLVKSPLGHRGVRRRREWDLIPHGTISSYQHLCRQHPNGPCDACRAAWAEYRREQRAGRRSQ